MPLDELVIYELHVGTFTPEGTFDAAIPRLPELARARRDGDRADAGRDVPRRARLGLRRRLTFAPHRAYGGPDGLARLVDAAHAAGLAVILDVVYNHIGPGSEARRRLRPVLHRRATTRSGATRSTTRSAACASGRSRTPSCGSATTASTACGSTRRTRSSTTSPTHVLAELAERVRAIRPGALVISEMEIGDRAPIEEWGHDAQWADELHHALHVLLTGERDGYYAPYGKVADLARALSRTAAASGSSSARRTTTRSATARSATACRRRCAASPRPCVALRAADAAALHGRGVRRDAPFQFFTDHDDPAIAEATREGRAQGVRAVRRVRAARTCPTRRRARRSSARSCDPEAGDAELRAFYRELLAPAPHAAARGRDRRRRAPRDPARAPRRASSSSPTSPPRPRSSADADGGLARQARSRSARRGTGRARTSRSSPRTPSASSSACSTTTATRRAIELTERTRSTGTATCPASGPASATATASTARTSPSAASASTRRSC